VFHRVDERARKKAPPEKEGLMIFSARIFLGAKSS